MNLHVAAPDRDGELGTRACRCRVCGAKVEQTVVDLGVTPLCESFLARGDLEAMEPFYPLHAMVCGECFLVQLNQYVAPEHIFSEYAYFSSYSSSWVAHARAYAEAMVPRLGLGPESLVVELASNDGYLLQHFGPLGVPALGIEPAANVAAVARAKGVKTVVDFFGRRLAGEMVKDGRQADLVIGNNVLAQVPDLDDFVGGIAMLLKPDGVATLEFPHLVRLLEENQFDTIYHEHFSYFSLVTVERMAAIHGLDVIDVEELRTHGGSLRVFLAHAGSKAHRRTARVGDVLAAEVAFGVTSLERYAGFGEKVRSTKRRLLSLLIAAKEEGKRIVAYGAPGKGNTLLNFCGIGPDFIDFAVDRNPYKHGRFTPGTRIPILPVDALDAARPDLVLILPWNLKDEITAQLRHIADWGGRFIVPIPEAGILDPKELQP